MPKTIKDRGAETEGAPEKAKPKTLRRKVRYLKSALGMVPEGHQVTSEDIQKGVEFEIKLGPAVAFVKAGMAEPVGWDLKEGEAALAALHPQRSRR